MATIYFPRHSKRTSSIKPDTNSTETMIARHVSVPGPIFVRVIGVWGRSGDIVTPVSERSAPNHGSKQWAYGSSCDDQPCKRLRGWVTPVGATPTKRGWLTQNSNTRVDQ